MAFAGRLLSVNGVEIPNKYIDIKTYYVTPNKRRIIKEYYDGLGKRHVIYSPHTSTEIEFDTNGLLNEDMRAFISLFTSTDNLSVNYYNDKTDTYQTGAFRLEDDIEFRKYNIKGNDILYKSVNIVLKED
jgi:hypothetical protein